MRVTLFLIVALLWTLSAGAGEIQPEVLPCTEEGVSQQVADDLQSEPPTSNPEEPNNSLSCSPKSCNDYPVPVGGTCSCSSNDTNNTCIRSCDGQLGQRVLTVCVICNGCTSPPCNIMDCNYFRSFSCREG